LPSGSTAENKPVRKKRHQPDLELMAHRFIGGGRDEMRELH